MRSSPRAGALLVLALCLTAGCDNPTTIIVDSQRPFVVHLTTPHADDGAVLITLDGLPSTVIEITSLDSRLVVYSARIADTLRIAVFGPIASGPLVQISSLRASSASLVHARVEEAASRTNELRDPSSDYLLALRPR